MFLNTIESMLLDAFVEGTLTEMEYVLLLVVFESFRSVAVWIRWNLD